MGTERGRGGEERGEKEGEGEGRTWRREKIDMRKILGVFCLSVC